MELFSDKMAWQTNNWVANVVYQAIEPDQTPNTNAKIMMKTLFLLGTFFISLTTTVLANVENNPDPVDDLKQEVVKIFEKHNHRFPDIEPQEVSIGFMINAKNELVIMDVQGNSVDACDYVKRVLNYRKVKYQQSKQLTGYSLKIQLVNDPNKS